MDEYFCPNCGAILNNQAGFDPSCGSWTCTVCGQHLMDDDVYEGDTYEGVAWYCDRCGTLLNRQPGFSDIYGSWICTECGHVNGTTENDILSNDSDKTDGKFICPNCGKFLDNQLFFNEYADDWICSECEAHLHHDYSDDPYSIVYDDEDNISSSNDSDVSSLGAIILLGLAGVAAANIKRHTKERTEHKKERKSPPNTSSSSTYSNPTLYSTPNAKRVKQKSFLQKHWKGTFLVVLSLAVIAATTFLIWEYQKLIPIGYDSNALIGVNYKAVISNLEDAGFTNVQVESTAVHTPDRGPHLHGI